MKRWGLKRKFITFFLALMIPILFVSLLIYYQTSIALKNQAIEEATERLSRNEQNLLTVFSTVEAMSSYMIYDRNFRKIFISEQDEMYQPDYQEAMEVIKGYFTFQLISNPYINSILLVGRDGHLVKHGEPVTGDEQELDKVAKESKGSPVWSNPYQVKSDWNDNKYVISLTRIINDMNNISEQIGIVRIRLDQMELYNQIEVPSQQSDYFIVSDKGEVILHPDADLVGNQFPDSGLIEWVLDGKEKSYSYQDGESHFVVVKNQLTNTDWFSVTAIDEDKLAADLTEVRALIGFLIGILLLAGILFFIFFYHSNIKRILELTKQTKQVETGNFTASVHVGSSDEIGKLGYRFNKMVKTIQKHIDTEYRLKIKQKESELKVLQNQINPHFLYNTLDMIRWNARLENAPETGQLIERLSKIFRMNLNNGKSLVTFEEEVEYSQAYLELQKKRLGEKLDYQIVMEEQLKGYYVMKQMIQPLIENSIQHGFMNLPRQGIIRIHYYRNENQAVIDVIDNGWGFSEHKKNGQLRAGYALKNLNDRISIVFGKPYGLSIIDSDEGAFLRMILPLLNEDKSKELGD
ncbi:MULTISPECIES: sensor histidine kinase [unclassified Oceanobacillus]|uniref:cache domain-containing sensor histidine kinase n=1 Tax=unclassified Oceanobacillus TaxID=2630292 RepID=UPI001BE9ACF8|nr:MULTISPECIES: sensor histidine kinase [unclassified Oceanobacillus]MBT2600978.1 sensor histidine kinase [Oceanobacillus sp. ISL-74]MBT2653571.1 sensor histidine kinase [Oceanobacillus sp. ISL-73]